MQTIIVEMEGVNKMSTHKHDRVNALTNPVSMNDIIIAESGDSYTVKQTLNGSYWLRNTLTGDDITSPVFGQVGIIAQIDQLINY